MLQPYWQSAIDLYLRGVENVHQVTITEPTPKLGRSNNISIRCGRAGLGRYEL